MMELAAHPTCYDVPMRRASTSQTAPADEVLIARAVGGERSAFETLYRRHVGRILALCMRMCGDRLEAEERVQDAFVRAWEKLDSFDGRSAFSSWMHRLTVNVVLGDWRRKGRWRDRMTDLEEVEIRPASSGPPVGAAIDLERAIAELPDGARTVFVLFDIEGYRHHEIAEMTGLTTGTTKAQLHRARQLLKAALG